MNNIKLKERVILISELFITLEMYNAGNFQKEEVANFKIKYPELVDDLDFCFEVLAGQHKLGYKLFSVNGYNYDLPYTHTIKEFYQEMLDTGGDLSETAIFVRCTFVPETLQPFFIKLVNREWRLGYTNKNNMVTDKHCMLAKTYPEFVSEGYYGIQEKLNGNRCIAYFEDGEWKYTSRSQKPKEYFFDMSAFDINRIYDGEVMRKGKMGNRDFAETSGLANSKYGDKSELVYFVYDILDSEMPYSDRYSELKELDGKTGDNVKILPLLDMLYIYRDPRENEKLDKYLDEIVEKGGEGVMLRAFNTPYYHSKHSGDRKPYLLKYKKLKTCDLRIVGWNTGNGKYTGMIGSFICESDDGMVQVSVGGMTDEVRMSDPTTWLDKIIEVAYFDKSLAKNKRVNSLQFPRMKGVRDDKTETSMF